MPFNRRTVCDTYSIRSNNAATRSAVILNKVKELTNAPLATLVQHDQGALHSFGTTMKGNETRCHLERSERSQCVIQWRTM